ncbi:MAG: hypothetical protein SGPRY_004141, partial [Prymnesium sp.]
MPAARLLWLLPAVASLRPPPPPAFDLEGACAGVKSRETWRDGDGLFHWSYKVKVSPWTTFGRITVSLHGWNMHLESTYYGSSGGQGDHFVVLLHPRAGADDCFEIQGTGESYADPDLRCSNLQATDTTRVLQTIVTMDFGESAFSIGQDLSGARVLEGGDGSSSSAVVSLLPLKNCLGMYKDASCDRSFSFTARLSPPSFKLPSISCVLTRDLPFPPPPMPPNMPPSPPPGFLVDPNLCYLGGYVHFSVSSQESKKNALHPWELSVHLNGWLAGLRVVLDFPGSSTAGHALHVQAVRPTDVARLLSVTRHSAILELQVTAARDFQFEALGDVSQVRDDDERSYTEPPHTEEVKQHARPILGRDELPVPIEHVRHYPPPPSVPTHPASSWMGLYVSVFILAVISVNVLLYRRDTACYMLHVAKLVRWARITATQSARGRKLLQLVGSSTIGRMLLRAERNHLGIARAVGPSDDSDQTLLPSTGDARPKTPMPSSTKKTRRDRSGAAASEERRSLANAKDAEDSADETDHAATEEVPRATTKLVIRTHASPHVAQIQLDGVSDMRELQRKVARVCADLGADCRGALRMQYMDSTGKFVTVSKSTSIASIQSSTELQLLPKEQGASQSRRERAPQAVPDD